MTPRSCPFCGAHTHVQVRKRAAGDPSNDGDHTFNDGYPTALIHYSGGNSTVSVSPTERKHLTCLKSGRLPEMVPINVVSYGYNIYIIYWTQWCPEITNISTQVPVRIYSYWTRKNVCIVHDNLCRQSISTYMDTLSDYIFSAN